MPSQGEGRESRKDRVVGDGSGVWGSSSQDFVRLAGLLFEHSAKYAASVDGNTSPYPIAGVPVLFSALRCLLIELGAGLPLGKRRPEVLADLAGSMNEVAIVKKQYPLPEGLSGRLDLLLEVRHEIIHPAHRPGPEPDGTPAYLRELKELGVLQTTGRETDYLWLDQLHSHRLFRWTFETVALTAGVIVTAHRVPEWMAQALRSSYYRYTDIDAV